VGLKNILWEATGKTPSLQDGQNGLGRVVTVCGVVKMMISGDFSRQAKADTLSCCNLVTHWFRELLPLN